MTNEEELRIKIIKLALLQYNKTFEHLKTGPDSFDCAGFVWFVYNELLNIDLFEGGIGLSRTTKIMTNPIGSLTLYKEKEQYKNLNLIKKGDIIFFHKQSLNEFKPTVNNKYPGHCGIYLGDGTFVHSSNVKNRVTVSSFEKVKWQKTLVAKKDILSN